MAVNLETIEAILGLVIAVLGVIAVWFAKLYSDGKKFMDIVRAFLDMVQAAIKEVKEANADGSVSQEEFTKILGTLDAMYAKGQELIAQGKVVKEDIEGLIKDLKAVVDAWKTARTK